jgi:hypothetical protein
MAGPVQRPWRSETPPVDALHIEILNRGSAETEAD